MAGSARAEGRYLHLGDPAVLSTPQAEACRWQPSVDCLVDVALALVAKEPRSPATEQVARDVAGAGRVADAYRLADRPGETDEPTDGPFRVAMREVADAARAHPDVAADLSPIEATAARGWHPELARQIGLRMVAEDLLGGDVLDPDEGVLSYIGRGLLPPAPVPRITVDVILARWREIVPGSPGPVSVLMALGDRAGAEAETARLVSEATSDDQVSEEWAAVGDVERMRAAEDGLPWPRADEFVAAAAAMQGFHDAPEAIIPVLRRALTLGCDPSFAGGGFTSARSVVDRIDEVGGRDAAVAAVEDAAKQVRGQEKRRRAAVLASLANADLDMGSPVAARRLIEAVVAADPPETPPPPALAVPLYRLGEVARFEAVLTGLGDPFDQAANSLRHDIWYDLLREADVEPTLTIVDHASAGAYGLLRSNLLGELAVRRMEAGREAEVPALVREMIGLDRESLAEDDFDMGHSATFDTLALAARLAWRVGDHAGAEAALRVMIGAAFEGREIASLQLARVASFWHRRLPEARL